MAKTKIEVELLIKGEDRIPEAEKKLGSLKSQLKELKTLLASGALTGKEFDEAAKRAGHLQDQIGDVSQRVKNLASDSKRLDGFVSLAQGIVGGFAAVQGITALVGDENKELEKTMVKLQGSMTALAGIQAVVNTLNKESALSTNLFSSAWGKLNNVMKASIIGAIIAAVLLLVSYWDDIKGMISGVDAETSKLAESTNKDFEASKKKTEELGSQDNILKLQGLSEKEILRSKIKQTEETIKAGIKAIEAKKAELTAQIESERRNKEILKGILDYVSIPLTLLLKTVDQVGKAFGKNFGLQEKFTESIANLIFDPEETKKKGEEELAALDKSLLDLKDKTAGYKLQIKAIDKKDSDDRAAAKKTEDDKNEQKNKENNDKLKAYADEQKKILEDANKIIAEENLTAREKELKALDDLYKEKIALAEDGSVQEKALIDALRIQKAELTKKYDEEDIAANKVTNDAITAEAKKADDDRIKSYVESVQAKEAIAQSSFDILSNIGELALGQQFKQTAAGKTLAIAQIAIDTALAISALVRNSEANPLNAPTSGLAGIAQFAGGIARITANIVSAKSILSGGGIKGSGGGGGGGSQTQSSNPPPITGFTRGTDASGNPITKVVVLEKDITNSQNRVARIRTNAELL